MGYDFSRLSFKHSRKRERTDVEIEARIEIYLSHHRLFDRGIATIVNLSESGALIREIVTDKGILPIEAFTVIVRIAGENHKDLVLEGRIVRLENNGRLDMGIEFRRLEEGARERLVRLIAGERGKYPVSSAQASE
jgi:hypothetical protein